MEIQSEKKKPGEMTIKEWIQELTINQFVGIVLFLTSLFLGGMGFQAWLKSQTADLLTDKDIEVGAHGERGGRRS